MFSQTYKNLNIIDLSTNIAGPLAAMTLGDMGADVIKVERAPGGDDTRQLTPTWEGVSTVYLSVNRNKRSLLLDFKKSEDIRTLKKLIAKADVVIESFPPGLGAKLGLSFDELKLINADIILCSISAFGDGEIGAKKPGYDALVQAVSGLMSFTGHKGQEPVRIAPSVLDISTGMWAAMSIMAAAKNRDNGEGAQHIRSALIDSAFLLMCHQVAGFKATGIDPEKLGSGAPSAVPYRVYSASDGSFMLATASDPQFIRLCNALDISELATDPRFESMSNRIKHRDQIDGVLENKFSQRPVAHWLSFLADQGLSVGPVNSVSSALEMDVIKERGLFHNPKANGWNSGMPLIRSPFDLDGSGWHRRPPALGEHTEEILKDLI